MSTKNQPKRMIITESGDFCRSLKGTVIENLKSAHSRTGYTVAKFFFQIRFFSSVLKNVGSEFLIFCSEREIEKWVGSFSVIFRPFLADLRRFSP